MTVPIVTGPIVLSESPPYSAPAVFRFVQSEVVWVVGERKQAWELDGGHLDWPVI